MTASALALAVEKKFNPKDDIRLVFNQPTTNLAPGETVHLYRVGHANPDPAAHLASMKTADALSTPVDRYRQVETTRLAQSEQTQREQQEQQEQVRSQGIAGQGGHRMMAS